MINLSDSLVLEKMPVVGARAIGVLAAISRFMNEHNQSWPSRKTLRALTGLGRDALDKDIRLLEEHRLAHKEQRRTANGRRLSSNRYTIPRSLARKYAPPAWDNPGRGQDTGFQDTDIQGPLLRQTAPQDTGFQDTGFQQPENPPGSIEYPFEVLNKQEVWRARYARACEEAEKLKRENEELRRRLENLEQEKENLRQEAESLRSQLGEAGGAPHPGCGAPSPRRETEAAGAGEAEPRFDTPTKNHKQAAEAFWSWALANGYLPGIIENARYPGTLEQARECCFDYFRHHQKKGRWINIWRAPTSKNLAGFEDWLVKDPLFYPKKYRDGKTGKTPGAILSEESARRVYATLLAEEGLVPIWSSPGPS